MKCPTEIYKNSDRKYEGTPDDLSYPGMDSRRVANQGCISWSGQWVFISGALAGWSVGLEPQPEGKYSVWFGELLLGQLDQSTCSFEHAEPPPPRSTDQKSE